MIKGYLAESGDPCIKIEMQLPSGEGAEIDAVIDTAFAGSLCLPRRFLEYSGLRNLGDRPIMLADGTIGLWPRYSAIVTWHGGDRHVDVIASEGEILIGTELLAGSRLVIEFADGGLVQVEQL